MGQDGNLSKYFYSYLRGKLSYYSALESEGQIAAILTHNLPVADLDGIASILNYINNHEEPQFAKDFYSALGSYINLKSVFCFNNNYCKDLDMILNLPQEIFPLETLYTIMKASCYRKFSVVAKGWKDPIFFNADNFTEHMSPQKKQEFFEYIYHNKMEEKLPYDLIISKKHLNSFMSNLLKEGRIGAYFSDCNPLKFDNYILMIVHNDVLSQEDKKKLTAKLYEIESKYDKEMDKRNMADPRMLNLVSEQRFQSWDDNTVLSDIEVKEFGKSKSGIYSDNRIRVYSDGQAVLEDESLSMEELKKGTHFGIVEEEPGISPQL